MRRSCFLFLIFFFPAFLFSQNAPVIPPGTIKLSDSIYIDQIPVTNLMYREFLDSRESFWSPEMHELLKSLPNYGLDDNFRELNRKEKKGQQSQRLQRLVSGDTNYLQHIDYREHPVLQVSKQEAEMFCRWRTDMVMLLWAIRSRSAAERKMYPARIKYRLPSYEELEQAMAHFEEAEALEVTREDSPLKITPKDSSDGIVFHHISEFTAGNEIFGENWRGSEPRDFPNDATGFRCICEIEQE